MLPLCFRGCATGALLLTTACAADPVPPSQPISRSPTLKTDGPLEKTTLTKEQRSALDAELGDGFAKAMEGNYRHPYGPVPGPKRGVTDQSFDVDYASIPLLSDDTLDKTRDPSGFRLVRTLAPAPQCGPGYGVGVWSMFGLDAVPKVIRIGKYALPSTDAGTGQLVRAPDIGILTATTADWTTLDERREPVTATRYEASYDESSGVATVKQKQSAHPLALPLAHDAIFVLRRCVAHCDHDLASSDREEEIEIIGPPALWIGTSADVDRQQLPNGQPFTDISARIAPGKSATVLLTVGDIADALTGAPPSPSPLVTTVSFETVWQAGHVPEATVFTTRLRREDANYVGTRPQSGFSEGCAPLR